jgi:hypothetical protein
LIPYRNSLRPFLPSRASVGVRLISAAAFPARLPKDSLGCNSRTVMITAIAPADYNETLSMLHYADQTKKIKNKAVMNDDLNIKLARKLKEELELLRGACSPVRPLCATR